MKKYKNAICPECGSNEFECIGKSKITNTDTKEVISKDSLLRCDGCNNLYNYNLITQTVDKKIHKIPEMGMERDKND